ncbi:MAG: hypothetical protein V4684_11985 [Pseudomonadota bacterium]
MNAITGRETDFPEVQYRVWPRIVIPVVLLFFGTDGFSQATPATTQLEVSTTSLPRFENIDGATRSSRIDMSLMPAGRSGFGVAVGVNGTDSPGFAPTGVSGSAPSSVDLGVKWRYTTESNNQVDIGAWRRIEQPNALNMIHSREPLYGARVEMRIQPGIQRGLVADKGFLGMQLESGARIGLRRSGGKPMVYYRTKF